MENEKRARQKKKSNMPKILFVLILIIIAIIVFFVVKSKNTNNNNLNKTSNTSIDNFIGNWTIDGITNYEFDGKGNGKLKLPKNEYSFKYTIENNEIYLDYEDEKATDSDYEYSFEDEKLVLKGINSTTGTYELTKQN